MTAPIWVFLPLHHGFIHRKGRTVLTNHYHIISGRQTNNVEQNTRITHL